MTPNDDYEREAAISALNPAAQCVVTALERLRREILLATPPGSPRFAEPERVIAQAVEATVDWLMGEQEPSDG